MYTLITAVSSSRPCSPYRARTALNVASLTCGDSSKLPPEANDERLVRRQAVQRPVRVDGVECLLARAACRPSRTCPFQM